MYAWRGLRRLVRKRRKARRPLTGRCMLPPWAKAILAVLFAALLITGLFAFITAQAVWNADIETMNVTVYDTEGMAHTLPGLAFDGALFVDAQAYDKAIAARHDGTLSVSPKYWGEQRGQNGGTRHNHGFGRFGGRSWPEVFNVPPINKHGKKTGTPLST